MRTRVEDGAVCGAIPAEAVRSVALDAVPVDVERRPLRAAGAVSAAGFCGFMLGTTANAVACMEELVEKHGPAPQSFLVVPIVGAFLIDFTNSLIITAFANWLR